MLSRHPSCRPPRTLPILPASHSKILSTHKARGTRRWHPLKVNARPFHLTEQILNPKIFLAVRKIYCSDPKNHPMRLALFTRYMSTTTSTNPP